MAVVLASATVAVPGDGELRSLLGYGPRVKVAPFHLVLRGEFDLVAANGNRTTLRENDVALCLEGRARLKQAAGGNAAELICGIFVMQSLPLNPLTLDAIAHTVGYGGGAALSKALKDRVGCSPAAWRASANIRTNDQNRVAAAR